MHRNRIILLLLTVGVMGLALHLARNKQTGTPAAQAGAPDKVVADMIAAARNLLAGLSPELRQQAALPFDHPARLSWHYYSTTPEPRKGAVLKKMSAMEKELVNAPWARKFRDSDLYYVTNFGMLGSA